MGRAFEVRKAAMAKTAAAKTKVYSKYGREIYVAAKNGHPDPDLNVELKRIIDKAKKDQVPNDIIKRAIDKAKGGSDDNYSSSRYEGFGPGSSQLIVECLTDNVNRTVAEVRNCFTKTGGKLGVSGSVIHQFVYQAIFEIAKITEDEVIEIAINDELDLLDVEVSEASIIVYGNSSDYYKIKTSFNLFDVTEEELAWLPLQEISLNPEEQEQFDKLLAMLNEVEDVQDVFYNIV